MKIGRYWVLLGAWLFAASVARASLLDEVIRSPGLWNQMCSMPRPLPYDVPLPLYSLATPRNYYLSAENLDRLRSQRASVVADIAGHLARMNLPKATNGDEKVSISKGAKEGTNQTAGYIVVNSTSSFSFTDSHQDPNQITGTLLDIILQLDAVEALPGLLRLEADLNQRLEAAAKDGPTALPALDLDCPVFWSDMNGSDFTSASMPGKMREFSARVYQREMLSVIAALLRHERFQPLLDSALEAKYFDHLKKGARERQLDGILAAADIPQGQEGWIGFDPIHKLPFRKDQSSIGFVPFTPELRLEIRQWAADYLKQTAGAEKSSAQRTGK